MQQWLTFSPCKRASCSSSLRNSAISASRDANIFCCCSRSSAISSSWMTSVNACCSVRPISVSKIGWTSASKSNSSPSTISVEASTPTLAAMYGGVDGRWRNKSVWQYCSSSGGREKSCRWNIFNKYTIIWYFTVFTSSRYFSVWIVSCLRPRQGGGVPMMPRWFRVTCRFLISWRRFASSSFRMWSISP